MNPAPSWKQEVNRRLAAHKNRQAVSIAETSAPAESHRGVSSRAAQAAARVAQRYAKAPSYSEMLAEEARVAVRAAKRAEQVAHEAHAAAAAVLAGLEAASANEAQMREAEYGHVVLPEPVVLQVAPSIASVQFAPTELDWPIADAAPAMPVAVDPQELPNRQPMGVRWDADMPVRSAESAAVSAPQASATGEWGETDAFAYEPQVVDPGQPAYANLIEFPRELVAARKARPRAAETAYAPPVTEAAEQLSIFEVDPGTIASEPEETASEQPLPGWAAPQWSGMELDNQPADSTGALAAEEVLVADKPATIPELQLAPLNRRLLAGVVDGALIFGSFCAAALVATAKIPQLPPGRLIEEGALIALIGIALFYQMLFFTLAKATPGMTYARIGVYTFDGRMPTRAQMQGRLGALLLSLLPLGLGVTWALFDEQHLSWHDRLSKTYLRKKRS